MRKLVGWFSGGRRLLGTATVGVGLAAALLVIAGLSLTVEGNYAVAPAPMAAGESPDVPASETPPDIGEMLGALEMDSLESYRRPLSEAGVSKVNLGKEVVVRPAETESCCGGTPHPAGEGGPVVMDAPFDPNALLAGGGNAQSQPDMVVSPNGTIYVAFENETSPGNYDIYIAWSLDGGNTWTENVVANDAWNERYPSLGESDGVLSIWYSQDRVGFEDEIYFQRSTDGGQTWSASFFLSLASVNLERATYSDQAALGGYVLAIFDVYDTAALTWTTLWFWSQDYWASFDSGTYWIGHDGDNWIRPYIGINQTAHSDALALADYNGGDSFHSFQSDNTNAGGDTTDGIWYIWNDGSISGSTNFFVHTNAFGLNIDEVEPSMEVTDDGAFIVFAADLAPNPYAIFGLFDNPTGFFLTFITFPDTANNSVPALAVSDSKVFVTFVNNTTSLSFVFSGDFGNTWTEAFTVIDNYPGTVVKAFHAARVGYMNKPYVVWQDDRNGNNDVYFTKFNASIYTITKNPVQGNVWVNGTQYIAPVSFIWPLGSTHNISVDSPENDPSPGIRYFFLNWSDGGNQTHNITVGANDTTVTANYRSQYFLTMTGTAGWWTPGDGWYDEGTSVMIWAFPPNTTWPWGERYQWNGWLGSSACGSEYTGGANPTNITMDCPISEQASWNHQYYLDVTSPFGTTTGSGWYTQGFTVPFSVTPTTVNINSCERVRFDLWSGQGNGSYDGSNNPWTVTLNAPIVQDAQWVTDYCLTVSTNFGTVEPAIGWYQGGTDVNVTAIPPSAVMGERYVWNGWTGTVVGMSNPMTVTINGPTTETADWTHEYYLTVDSPYGTTSGEGWYVDGTTSTAGLSTGTIPGTGTRWVFAQWTGDATGTNFAASNPITMNAPKTAVAQWTTQHYLTVTSPFGVAGGEGWYDEGTTATATLDTGLVSGGPGIRSVFVQWTGGASGTAFAASDPITMNGPKTATAEWVTQYRLTLTTNTGTTDPPDGWYDDGSVLYIVATPPSLTYSVGERYQWNGWTGTVPGLGNPMQITMSSPVDNTADWTHEYYLTVDSPYGTTSGEGWYVDGASPTAGLSTGTIPGATTQRLFTQWTGDASGTSFTASSPILMNAPKTAVAQWRTQYMLTITSAWGTATGDGWYDEGASATAMLDTNLMPLGAGTQDVFARWTKDASGTNYFASDPITMAGPREAVAEWVTQYQLTMSTNLGTTSPVTDLWYDSGETVEVIGLVPAPAAGERYTFLGWTGTGVGSYTGTSNPGTVTMNAPITETADWDHDYYLTVTSTTGSPSGEGWYDDGASASFSVTTPSSGGTGVRFVFSSWTGDSTSTNPSSAITMDAPKAVEAVWDTEYQLTVTTPQSTASCDVTDCWYLDGASATALVTDTLVVDSGNSEIRYDFRGWGGAASGLTASSDPITMDSPMTALALWTTQYHVEVTATSGTGPLTGVPIVVDGGSPVTTPTTTIWLDDGTTHLLEAGTPFELAGTRYAFSNWVGGGTSPGMTVTPTAPVDLSAQYVLATGTIRGIVRSERNGDPVAGATVTAGTEPRVTTGTNGTYTMTVPDGTYTVTVAHGEYDPESETGVIVGIGDTVTLDFLMDSSTDTDDDGLPDAWELKHFGDLFSQGADDDPDKDGFTNLQEYNAGTDPTGSDFLAAFWWLWLVLFLVFVILTIGLGIMGRRRRRPQGEVYEELYGVPPAAEEVVVEEAAEAPVVVAPVKPVKPVEPAKPTLPPPPVEEEPPVAEEAEAAPTEKPAADLPECPNCGLINEAGAKECAVCGSAIQVAPAELTTEERIARLDEALKEGKITTEQYQANLKRLMSQ